MSTAEIETALKKFADAVLQKFSTTTKGEPEEQLRAPFETLLTEVGEALKRNVVPKGEHLLPGRQGKPDYAVVVDGALTGYAELKAPGSGVIKSQFRGRNRSQWNRFSALPNLLYCDGSALALYRTGEQSGAVLRLTGDITTDGSAAVDGQDAARFERMITEFFGWQPIVPSGPRELADVLAPLCRLLRDNVEEAVKDKKSPLALLKRDWQMLLFPDADDAQFADAYAQTVTYALLLARAEGATKLDGASAAATLQAEHSLIARALQVLTEQSVQAELGTLLDLLDRTITAVPATTLATGKTDPWFFFYEHFLAAYDNDLRRNAGVYYTPTEIVRCQVRLADELLRTKLGRQRGLAEDDVITLDPAVGTGTYLIGCLDHSLDRIAKNPGPGAVPARATAMAKNLNGFELMVGPYTVAQLRLTRDVKARGGALPADGAQIFLTDSLEHPTAKAKAAPLPQFVAPLAEEHARAQAVKDASPVLVCIGNPPYDRHDAGSNLGGWVRQGAQGQRPILDDFVDPAKQAGFGQHLKNLYNLYVYFWRWALWKVYEHTSSQGPGIITFISASSYLAGRGFVGMREQMRRDADEIWIIDLGGDNRGTRKEENVFDIQIPVAIAITARYGAPDPANPAVAHYTRIKGDQAGKRAQLDVVEALSDLAWQTCGDGWHDPFRPVTVGSYFDWAPISELFPWQHSGVQTKRTWPIGPTQDTLRARWKALMEAKNRAVLFEEKDRPVTGAFHAPGGDWISSGDPIEKLPKGEPVPEIVPYAFRSLDRQLLIADYRVISRPRPDLWRAHSDSQIYLTTLLTHPLGGGPGLTVAAERPDLHHFRGSYGGADIIPLWRDADASDPNVRPGLCDMLVTEFGFDVSPEDFAAYVVAVVACPAYTERFEVELEELNPHIPLTRDPNLFKEAVELGHHVIWLQTYGERAVQNPDRPKGKVVQGTAGYSHAVSHDPGSYPAEHFYDEATRELRVGDGVFDNVAPEVWNYEVSGLEVVDSWLDYRMRGGAGKGGDLSKVQPASWDASMSDALLELLWTIERLIALEAKQKSLLDRLLQSPLFNLSDLPDLDATAPERLAPKVGQQSLL